MPLATTERTWNRRQAGRQAGRQGLQRCVLWGIEMGDKSHTGTSNFLEIDLMRAMPCLALTSGRPLTLKQGGRRVAGVGGPPAAELQLQQQTEQECHECYPKHAACTTTWFTQGLVAIGAGLRFAF